MAEKITRGMGGDAIEVADGGVIQVKSGGRIFIEDGGEIAIGGLELDALLDGASAANDTTGKVAVLGTDGALGVPQIAVSTADGSDEVAIDLGVIGKIRRFQKIVTLATDGETTEVGLTPAGVILAAAIRVSTQITGLTSGDNHIQLGVAGTLDKYADAAQGASATTISVNKKASYAGAPVAESAALILTVVGGADATPSAGAVEVEVLYIARANLANG